MNQKKCSLVCLLNLLILIAIGAVAGLYGVTSSLNRTVRAVPTWGETKGIGRDGWIAHDAELAIEHLSSRGNFLELGFNTWRPPGADDARFVVKVCDGEPLRYVVGAGTTIAVPLKGSCYPRIVSFDVENPFVPSAKDNRQLGAQLKTASITSRIGVPLFSLCFASLIAGGVALLSVIGFLTVGGRLGYAFGVFLALSSGAMLSYAPYSDLSQTYYLWLLFTTLGIGYLLASRFIDSRELRKPTRATSSFWWIAAMLLLVGVGMILRLYGIEFGLPVNFHPDEVPKVNAIMGMRGRGNLDPNYFLHPSVLLYATYGMSEILRFVGVDWDLRTLTFLGGRLVSVIAGSFSIALLFVVGRKLFSRFTGLFAAAILTFTPLHVTCSRYLKEDSLLCFFLLLTIVLVVKAAQEDKPWLLFLAAFTAGLSASTKYSGFLTAAIIGAAPFLRSRSFIPDRRFIVWGLASLVVVPVAFFIGTPYSIFNSKKFLSDFGFEQRHMLRGHTQAIDAWSQYWMYHFSRSVLPGMTPFTTVVSVAGMGVLLWRRRIEDLFIVGLILFFYLPAEWVKAKPAPQPERYIFPCLPFLALAGAEFVRIVYSARSSGFAARAAGLVVGFIFFFTPFSRSVAFARDIPNDTRLQAARWMKSNLPKGAPVYLDWQPYTSTFKPDEFAVDFVLREGVGSKLQIAELKKSGKKYLLLSSLFYDRYFKDPHGDATAKSRIRNVFNRVPIIREFTVQTGTYGFHNPRLTLFSLLPEDFASLEVELQKKQIGEISATSNEQKTVFRW